VLEGRNYREHKDNSSFTIVATLTSKDIKKALKIKELPIVEELKSKLSLEIRDIIPLFSR
jgi:hypothetical protein